MTAVQPVLRRLWVDCCLMISDSDVQVNALRRVAITDLGMLH